MSRIRFHFLCVSSSRLLAPVALCMGALVLVPRVTSAQEPLVIRQAQLTVAEQVELPARESGILQELKFHEGEVVEAGQIVGQIDDEVARLAAAKARSELALAAAQADSDLKIRYARKSAEVAKAELNRSLESVAKYPKSVSQTELDRLTLAAQKAELEIEQAELDQRQLVLQREIREREFQAAELNVSRRQLTAPLSGTIVAWKKQRGEYVEAGTSVVRIVRLNPLRIDTFLPSAQARQLTPGQTIRFLPTASPSKPTEASSDSQKGIEGVITFISPEVDPVAQQIRVWMELPNPELNLRPGDRGELTIPMPKPQ